MTATKKRRRTTPEQTVKLLADAPASGDGRMLSPNAPRDMCECGCSRVGHAGLMGHLHCEKHPGCKRFTWSHFTR